MTTREKFRAWEARETAMQSHAIAHLIQFYRCACLAYPEMAGEEIVQVVKNCKLYIPRIKVRCDKYHMHEATLPISIEAWMRSKWGLKRDIKFKISMEPIFPLEAPPTYGFETFIDLELNNRICPNNTPFVKGTNRPQEISVNMNLMGKLWRRVKFETRLSLLREMYCLENEPRSTDEENT